jgi:hypothetical protein
MQHPATNDSLLPVLAAAVRQHNARNSRRSSPASATDLVAKAGAIATSPRNPLVALAHSAMKLADARMAKGLPGGTALRAAVKCLRTLDKIRIDRIAAVDRPCNQHAIAAIVKHAPTEANMHPGKLAALEAEVDTLLAKLDRALGIGKRKQTFTLSHDDGADSGEGDASNPSLDAHDNTDAADDDAYDDTGDDGDDNDNNGDGADDNDDSDDDEHATVLKASVNAFLRSHSATDRPGTVASSRHPPNRHKFEALSAKIANEEGMPKSQAQSQARRRYPTVYQSYQRHQQPLAGSVFKSSAPTFDDLVASEMAKGVNAEVAGQRVLQLHGADALRHRTIAKRAADIEDTFAKRAEAIWSGDPDLDRCSALRKLRQENPALYKALQAV